MTTSRDVSFLSHCSRLLWGVTPLLGVTLLLAGVLWIGKLTRDRVRSHPSQEILFADIDCPAPPGMKRGDFLDEVQYLAEMPVRLHLLDDDLPARLAKAFAGHPWVEKVDRVEIGSAEPRVRARLAFRIPVLVVKGTAGLSTVRLVDRHGILLPASASGKLPTLEVDLDLSNQAAGKPLTHPAVEAVVATAAFLQSYHDRLQIKRFAATEEGIVFWTAAGERVLWGRPVGAETGDEPSAEVKVRRLLSFPLGVSGEQHEYDLRPRDNAQHSLLGQPR